MTRKMHPTRLRRAVRAGLILLTAAAASLTTSPTMASAAPQPADLVIDVSVDPAQIGPDGGEVTIETLVRNAGGANAEDVTVKFALPDGASFSYGEPPYGWTCDGRDKCRFGTLQAGEEAALALQLTLPPGADGQTAEVRASAATSSREATTSNNAGTQSVTYVVRPDLALTAGQNHEISALGGQGARAFVHAWVTNEGTAAAADVRIELTPPPGTWLADSGFDTYRLDCDSSAATWVCTGGPLEPGAAAGVNLELRFPSGTVGEELSMPVSASTSTPEMSLADNATQETFRYVMPPPADVALIALDLWPQQVRAGEEVTMSVYVGNQGGRPAEDVRLRIPLPDTVEATSVDPGDPDWTCAASTEPGARAIECSRTSYDTQLLDSHLLLTARVGAGTPAGPLTLTATATTSSEEATAENNEVSGTTTYLAEGTVSGRGWLDADGDGQRDPGEQHVTYEVGKIEFLREGTTSTWDTPRTTVNEMDGTYAQRLPVGRYVVHLYARDTANVALTTPDVGDDATDSDFAQGSDVYGVPIGTAAVEVRDGMDVAVDFGYVTPAQ